MESSIMAYQPRTGIIPYGRKRYFVGKYIRRKYLGRPSGLRSYKKYNNIKRNIKSNMVNFKLEYNDYIGYGNAAPSASPVFAGTSLNYRNLTNIIQNAVTWGDIINDNYQFYKINGIAVRVGKVFQESTTELFTNAGIPPIYIAYYPVDTSIDQGTNPLGSDSNLRIDPYVMGIQSKYWAMPKNFTNLGNGNGLGTWNNVGTINSLLGQISIAAPTNGQTAARAQLLFEIRFTVYIQVCNTRN